MIRIEIEVCELDTGKIVTVCKAIQGCQKEPTSGEDRVAGELFDMLRRECPAVGKRLGTCEEIEGEELERRSEFLFIDDPQTKKDEGAC